MTVPIYEEPEENSLWLKLEEWREGDGEQENKSEEEDDENKDELEENSVWQDLNEWKESAIENPVWQDLNEWQESAVENPVWLDLNEWKESENGEVNDEGDNSRNLEEWKENEYEEEEDESEISDDRSDAIAEDESFSWWLKKLLTPRWLRKCIISLPRLMALLLGVLLPLALLIIFSILFGFFLGSYEGPHELSLNDSVMRASFILDSTSTRLFETSKVPKVCLTLFLQGINASNINFLKQKIKQEIWHKKDTGITLFSDVQMEPAIVSLSTTDVFNFLDKCGNACRDVVQHNLIELAENVTHDKKLDATLSNLQFNWIRCIPGAANLTLDMRWYFTASMTEENQSNHFKAGWRQDQERLYAKYLEENKGEQYAFDRSVHDATGEGVCDLNGPASAWFWFIIMTTIGYGNQNPHTPEGYILVLVLGTVSMVAFTATSGTAGFIVLTVFEECMSRVRMIKPLIVPWIALVFWGFLWISWLCVLTAVNREWFWTRQMEDDFNLDIFYLFVFSYISATTVGLGTLFWYPSAVFVTRDLIIFPPLLLFSFVTLAAFFAKLTALLHIIFVGEGKLSITESLVLRKNASEEKRVDKIDLIDVDEGETLEKVLDNNQLKDTTPSENQMSKTAEKPCGESTDSSII